MVLRRSDSAKTTLSMFITRSTKYRKWLGMINVILLLGSLSLMFAGQILKISYYMDQLSMISQHFGILPWLLIGCGGAAFIVSAFGFIFSSTIENRGLLYVYAICCITLCLSQFLTIFVAMEARQVIGDSEEWTSRQSLLDDYVTDEAVKYKWDYLQSRLRCCGVSDFFDYRNQRTNMGSCVPDSCCYSYGGALFSANCYPLTSDNGCKIPEVNTMKFYVRGCLAVLQEMYKNNLELLMLIAAVSCSLYALILLIATTLAFAFAAQINRRAKREREQWTPGEPVLAGMDHGNSNIAMDEYQGQQ